LRRLPLGVPVQVAYAVHDVREAATYWAASFGAGPFVVVDHISLSEVRYRGRPGVFDHSSAFGQWGNLMVELVCDHNGTLGNSPVADVVGIDGVGLHHLAYFVDDFAAAQLELASAGFPELLSAQTNSGQSFAFHDARDLLGHLVEIYEPTAGLVAFYRQVAESARDWDGTDPIRSR
jgi:catechol 2,3-dioxygenase-like lactoylglutathione lyase family enzyme